MKKLAVSCWLLAVGVAIAAGVAQAEMVEYRDYDAQTGTFTNAVRECALVTGETRILESGWWAVDDEVAIPTVTNLTVIGTAHLILCDGARLTASAVGMQPGVSVRPGNALAIYGQTAGTGTLTAGGGKGSAGIGGGGSQDGGTVTICGGVIVAQGGEGAAGIGGGRNYISGGGGGGTITIHGGTVTATGGAGQSPYFGAGIGGGYDGAGGLVTIDGGAVTATGGEAGVDPIGNGSGGRGCQVEISGGLFSERPKEAWLQRGCKVVENTDEATKGDYPWKVEVRSVTVTIGEHPNLTVAWTRGDGSVMNPVEGTTFQIRGEAENVKVIFAPELAYDLVGDAVVSLGTVTTDIVFGKQSGYKVPQAVPNGAIVFRDYDATTGTFTNAARKCTLVTSATRTLENGWYAVQGTVTIPEGTNLTVNGTVHLILCDGAKLTIPSPGEENAGVNVPGDASLVIYGQTAGTGALTAMRGDRGAGIGGGKHVAGGTVTINGGSVTARSEYGAGIGGGDYCVGGAVTINAGTVTAYSEYGTGIGGGWSGWNGVVTINGGAINANSMRGDVQIRGGIFTNKPQTEWVVQGYVVVENPDEPTRSAYPYAVIGVDIPYLDWDSNQRKLTNAVLRASWIEVTEATRTLENGRWYVVTNHVVFPDDAKLTVNGSARLILCDGASLKVANMKYGRSAVNVSEGASLVIYGQIAGTGALTATGGQRAAAIGGDDMSASGAITINGGTVTATGGYQGAGIGGGYARSGTVTINGGAVTAIGTEGGSDIGPGWGGDGGSVAIFGGTFARAIQGEWIAEGYAIGGNPDSATSAAYPYAVMLAAFTVTISEHPHSTVQWIYADGAAKSRVTGTSFKIGTGMTGVSVVFTPEHGYRFVEEGETGVRTLPSPVSEDCEVAAPAVAEIPCELTLAVGAGIRRAAYVCGGITNELVTGETVAVVQLGTRIELIVEELPLHYPFAGRRTFTVEQETMRVEIFASPIPKGMEGNPFQIGADVFATTNAAGVLTITGTGAMGDFASAEDVPWVPATVTTVTVGASVTQIGANAWSGMGDSVVINGTALSAVRYLAPGIGSAQPAGAISGAEFERVEIIDGKAYLGVAVCTNGDVTATTEGWGAAKLDPAAVEQAEDGKGLVIPVPATAEKGFMILKSKGK